MNTFALLLGLLVFLLTAIDIVKTTFSSSGGGWITDAVSKGVWKGFFVASGKNGRSKLLPYAGPAILVSILLTWVLGLWLGLFLVLLSDGGSIIKSSNMSVASPLEKLYYAGFTLSTLGVGDYIASNNLWRIITGVAAFSGLAFITASITYFVPVLSAVGLQSKLSLYISGMGRDPQQILINSWNGSNFSSFFDTTSDMCQMLMQHIMNHHSYPVIHYFHNSQPKLAISRAIVLLDESHKLLMHGIKQEAGLNELKMNMLQTAIDSYLDMVKGNYLKNASPQENAAAPELRRLEAKGLPLKEKEKIKEAFIQELHERRKLLTALLEMDGWSWQEVYCQED
ncbi:potassium channel family protein [Pontibacter beigongshangensis]|uniref:potassium channel family protein n=1 Tax=Pontibacter beigongshangensis TaxID=2574733 RepID=UPI0016509A09|nr:potassium channel family protein [Pontibacter beigongshangensis]